MAKKCFDCEKVLTKYDTGYLCADCQEERIDNGRMLGQQLCYNKEQMADILDLCVGSVERLARDGKLPPRIPDIKEHLWLKDVVHSWMKSGRKLPVRIDDKAAEFIEATTIALQLGLPVDIITMNGQYPDRLIGFLQKHGYLEGDPPQEIVDDLV